MDSYTQGAHEAVDRAAETAGRVAGKLGERLDDLQEKGEALIGMPQGWMESARSYVRENPLQALGIALAAGYVLSLLMRDRSE
ncbi:MAG: hypothetical protein JO035_11465 [Betaproteobacteria bacterium]|nr:hypothetical protein [Betaproteobacteria bacterium]